MSLQVRRGKMASAGLSLYAEGRLPSEHKRAFNKENVPAVVGIKLEKSSTLIGSCPDTVIAFKAVWIDPKEWNMSSEDPENLLVRDSTCREHGGAKWFFPGVLSTCDRVIRVAVLITRPIPVPPNKIDWNVNEFRILRESIPRPFSGAPLVHGIKGEAPQTGMSAAFTCLQELYSRNLFSIIADTKQFSALDPKIVHRLMRLLLEAVSKVNETHIHQDIKPENVLILGDINEISQVKMAVCDFGFSLPLEKDPNPTTKPLPGTDSYMAPERVNYTFERERDPAREFRPSIKGDAYAVGFILWCMFDRHEFDRMTRSAWEDKTVKAYWWGLNNAYNRNQPVFTTNLSGSPLGRVILSLLEPRLENRASAAEALIEFDKIIPKQLEQSEF